MHNLSQNNFSSNIVPTEQLQRRTFSLEERFSIVDTYNSLQKYWALTIPLAIAYVIAIHLGVNYMKNRPKYQLRGPLFAWNAFLSCFYIFGLYRMIPEVVYTIERGGFYAFACGLCQFGCTKVYIFWLYHFSLIKIPELLDTSFVVLRKQPLLFLHWYHHCTVLVFTFYLGSAISSLMQVFAVVNALVHAVMYFYYALKSLSIRVPRFVSMTLTMVQLFQMVIGLFSVGFAYSMNRNGMPCFVSGMDITVAIFIYFSYFVLFSWFFYQAYFVKDALRVAKSKNKKIE